MTARSSFHGATISVFQKTANRVEKEKSNTNINLDEGEEESKHCQNITQLLTQ